jgi:hypothetical protein
MTDLLTRIRDQIHGDATYDPHQLLRETLPYIESLESALSAKSQAEINNYLLTKQYAFGDRVEFDEDRNVVRRVKTRAGVRKEQEADNGN